MNTGEYQNLILTLLRPMFGVDLVEKEWDTLKYDTHLSNHKQIYGPRLDIAIGPFNGMVELDTPLDATDVMKDHPLTKRIVEEIAWDQHDYDTCWNDFSRCYMAIEMELGRNGRGCNSLKHILGSLINATVSGSIGVVLTDSYTHDKVERLYWYLQRLKNLERLQVKTIDNLVIMDIKKFMDILSEIG